MGQARGQRTLALYGRPYFSLLVGFCWGRVKLEALIEYRAGMYGAEAKPEALR